MASVGPEILAAWRLSIHLFATDCFGFVPDAWQAEGMDAWDRGDQRIAFQACKGPGKTALLAIFIWHFLATRGGVEPHSHPLVAATSISGDQLFNGLWPELARWQQRSPYLLRTFEWTKTRIECRDHRATWWAEARTWARSAKSETLANTLAGLHADHVLFVLDETGGMPLEVMQAAEGAMATGKETRIVQAGNPLQAEGPLWIAAKRDRKLWTVIEITGDPDDARRSPRIPVKWAQQMIDSYGRDNPFVMATVLGKFPNAGPLTFISEDLVMRAVENEARAEMSDPLVIGVDVARYGDDKTVIRFRKGRDARTHPPIKLRNLDNMQVATRVATVAREMQADAIFVDGGGTGSGVIDILRGVLHVANVIEVNFGGSPDGITVDPANPRGGASFANKGAEMYGALKAWLPGGAIDDDLDLRNDLKDRRYAFKIINGKECIVLEPKDAMKQRGLASPDDADALALTFALPVHPHANAGFHGADVIRGNNARAQTEYDPFAESQWPADGTPVREYNPLG